MITFEILLEKENNAPEKPEQRATFNCLSITFKPSRPTYSIALYSQSEITNENNNYAQKYTLISLIDSLYLCLFQVFEII